MPPSKKVSFNPTVKVFVVEAHPTATISELWYSRDEEYALVKANLSTIKRFRENSFIESSMETFLGLERYLIRTEIKKKRGCVCNAVLQAQLYCQSNGENNAPEQIASVYKEAIDICSEYFC